MRPTVSVRWGDHSSRLDRLWRDDQQFSAWLFRLTASGASTWHGVAEAILEDHRVALLE
jgi:hypothetical protein